MRIGSLCSGYGGLDMAVSDVLGASVAWHVEYDADPSAILAHHWPDVPNHGDVKATDWTAVEPIDVLTAGYPCQPFSHAGKRKGSDDPRHLWPAVATAIGALRPRLIVLENVRGHVSLGLADVLADLSGLGYDARWGVVRAADAGAPHGRARVFIVAAPHPLHDGRHGRGIDGGAPSARGWWRDALGPSDAASNAAGIGRDTWRPEPARGLRGPAAVQRGGSAADTGRERHGGRQESAGLGRVDGPDAGEARERERPRRVTVDRGAAAAADTDDAGGAQHGWSGPVEQEHGTAQHPGDWGPYGPAVRRWERVLGRSAPLPTELGPKGPRLSPAFVEWMMGLPAGHVTGAPIGRAAQLKALGNGVVPQQAALALGLLGVA